MGERLHQFNLKIDGSGCFVVWRCPCKRASVTKVDTLIKREYSVRDRKLVLVGEVSGKLHARRVVPQCEEWPRGVQTD